MKKLTCIFMMLVLSAISTTVFALDFGANVTDYDNHSTTQDWHGTEEDQEVEPNCVHGQEWDLEGFFSDKIHLTIVGGYDLQDGQGNGSGLTFLPGDLFLDTDNDMLYGDTAPATGYINDGFGKTVANNYGYDYVLHFNQDTPTPTYSVYQIDGSARLESVYYRQNDKSGAWRYLSGGTEVEGYQNVSYQYYDFDQSDAIAAATGTPAVTGGLHNALTVDLSFLIHSDIYWFKAHYTMGCGNDDLIDGGSPLVPEPGTLILLGSGLLGLFAILRKRLF